MTNLQILEAIERISKKTDTTSDMLDGLSKLQDEIIKKNPNIPAEGHIVREFMVVSGYIN